MVLTYLPDGTNIYRLRGGEFEWIGMSKKGESWKIVFLEGHFLLISSDTFVGECITQCTQSHDSIMAIGDKTAR